MATLWVDLTSVVNVIITIVCYKPSCMHSTGEGYLSLCFTTPEWYGEITANMSLINSLIAETGREANLACDSLRYTKLSAQFISEVNQHLLFS